MLYNENDARLGADIKDLEPSPGEGKVGGGTENPLVTETKDVGRGTPVQTVVAPKFGDKVEQAVVNFLNGIKIKGKNLEDYIDSEGGVTQEELNAALQPILAQLGNIDVSKLPKIADLENPTQEELTVCYGKVFYTVRQGFSYVYFPFAFYQTYQCEYFCLKVGAYLTETTVYRYTIVDVGDGYIGSPESFALEKGTKMFLHSIVFKDQNDTNMALFMTCNYESAFSSISHILSAWEKASSSQIMPFSTMKYTQVTRIVKESNKLIITWWSVDDNAWVNSELTTITGDDVTEL